MSRYVLIVVSLLGCAFCATPVFAQVSALAELYGEGVHQYFAKDYFCAEQTLTRAIDNGSQDPRVFYFRGLAREATGGEGSFDFEEGARLEAAGKTGVNVGQALTRIQGCLRAKIEKARRDGRLHAQQQRALMQQAIPATPSQATPFPTQPPAATDPILGDGLRSPDVEAVPAPIEPAPAGTVPDDSKVNPFNDEATPPAETKPTEDVAPAEGSDPFGGDSAPSQDPPAEGSDDPFGT